jgi:DNA replication and repair protein RecF
VYVAALSLSDFRSYADLDLRFDPGVTALVGANGQGKTNLVEAINYLATLSSHRVASDAPLVRHGAARAVVRAQVVRDGRNATLEVEINPGRTNRARVNRTALPRARELLGLLRSVMFAPEDLALVKADPDTRRTFLDELLVLRTPRLAAVRADYDRVLRQRSALLKSAGKSGVVRAGGGDLATLEVWDAHLAQTGAQLLAARLELVTLLQPFVTKAYDALAPSGGPLLISYRSTVPEADATDVRQLTDVNDPVGALTTAMHAQMQQRRRDELERGVCLVGPHRDDLLLSLGEAPAKGYASHGESWSAALALRLAAYDLLRSDGDDPILILDDVFAELDAVRRDRLAAMVADAEQVLVTAAVDGDVPAALRGARLPVVQAARPNDEPEAEVPPL